MYLKPGEGSLDYDRRLAARLEAEPDHYEAARVGWLALAQTELTAEDRLTPLESSHLAKVPPEIAVDALGNLFEEEVLRVDQTNIVLGAQFTQPAE